MIVECSNCGNAEHPQGSIYCIICGEKLEGVSGMNQETKQLTNEEILCEQLALLAENSKRTVDGIELHQISMAMIEIFKALK